MRIIKNIEFNKIRNKIITKKKDFVNKDFRNLFNF